MRRAASKAPELPGYRFVELLGSGGFSDVFRYEQQLPRRMVAVKVLLTESLTPQTRQAVRRRGESHGDRCLPIRTS